MRILCDITETVLPGDYADVDGVVAECSRCRDTAEAYGTSEASVSRALVTLREECSRRESNFYVADR